MTELRKRIDEAVRFIRTKTPLEPGIGIILGTGLGALAREIVREDEQIDRLDVDHRVDVRGRLEIHPYAVPATDLLLQRLQARAITDDDLKDVILMLVAAPTGDGDGEGETINATYVARLLADDWSFCTTATANLRRIQDAVERVPALARMDRATAVAKADQLVFRIEGEPKSKAWRARAARAGRVRSRAQRDDAGE